MLKLAYEAGLTPTEFWNATWDDVWATIDGYNARELNAWKRTREIITMIYNTAQGRKGKAKKSTELMPFPDDMKEKTPIDREKLFREMRINAEKTGIIIPEKWRV